MGNSVELIFHDLPSECVEGLYFNIQPLISEEYPILFVYGGRGTGKTYSTLKFLHGKRHAFIRRTQDEIKTLCALDNAGSMSASESPWRQLNEDYGWCVKATRIVAGRYAFMEYDEWEHDKDVKGKMLANIIALHDAGKVKGAGYENVEYIFYDEFIPLTGTRDTKDDGYHLQQIFETISRNLEMNQGKRTKLICCANASTIANACFMEWGIVNYCVEQYISGQAVMDIKGRGIRVVKLPDNQAFLEKKKQSALYQSLPETSRMYASSIGNEMTDDDWHDVVKKFDMRQYRPYAVVSSKLGKVFTIFEYKLHWRIVEGVVGNCNKVPRYDLRRDNEKYKLKRVMYSESWLDYEDGVMSFETYEAKLLYLEIVDKLKK